MATTNPAHIVLHNVRLSYVHLTQPYSQNGGDPKYSAVVLVPKNPAENRAKIDAAIRAATEKARQKYGAAFPAQPKISVHDGDGARPSDNQPFGEECRGCWVFTASSKTRPTVVDGNMQAILDPAQLYSGMYANVGVTFFGYNAPQNKGVGVALDNVQKVADGEPLGGARASAEDDFTPIAPAQQAASGQPFTGYAAQPAGVVPGYAVPAQAAPGFAPQPAGVVPGYAPPAQAVPGYAPAGYAPQPAAPSADPFAGQPTGAPF